MLGLMVDWPDLNVTLDKVRGSDRMNEDRDPPGSESLTSGVVFDGHSYGNEPMSECSADPATIAGCTHSSLSHHQQRTLVILEEGRSNQQRHPGVRVDAMITYIPSYRLPVAKRARKGTLLGGANEAAEKFSPLKVALGSIPAIFANREVRLHPPGRNHPLTQTFLGNCHRGKQDREPPLTGSRVGRTFWFAPGGRGGAEVPGQFNTVCGDIIFLSGSNFPLVN